MSTEPVTIDRVPPEVASARDAPERDALPALLACLEELAGERVRYCSWKSNAHLLAALAGKTDVDLLVDQHDAAGFAVVASRCGLKRVVPPPETAYPAMDHYLGLDRESGRLYHLHVHFQLVLGERYVKNHRLPVEGALLDSTRDLHGVVVPTAALELGVLAVRTLLKYRARDVVKDLLRVRTPGIPLDTRAEIEWLRGGREVQAIRSGLAAIDTVVPVDIVCSFLEVVAREPRSGFDLARLGTRLRRALRHRRRRSRVRAGATYALALWRHRRHLRLGGRDARRMTLPAGGTTVALIGADGSGKSTVAGQLQRWLGWKLEAQVHYLGSKAPSPPTDWLYLGFRALRRSHRAVCRRLGDGSRAARPVAALRDLALALHYLSVGRDRRRHYARAQRHACAGGIVVVFDRYPLACLSDRLEHRLLDGPQIAAVLGPAPGRLGRALASIETRCYQGFELPDHLVLLEVDPVVAAHRKPDHRLDVIGSKARAATELAVLAQEAGVDVTRIDANRPLDRVLVDVKARLWHAL